jgi:hypothetical protein
VISCQECPATHACILYSNVYAYRVCMKLCKFYASQVCASSINTRIYPGVSDIIGVNDRVHPVRFHSKTFHKQLLRPTRHKLRPLYCLQTNKRQSYTVYSTIFSSYCIYFSKVCLNSFLEKIQSIQTYNVHAKKICTISLNQSPEARVGLLDGWENNPR